MSSIAYIPYIIINTTYTVFAHSFFHVQKSLPQTLNPFLSSQTNKKLAATYRVKKRDTNKMFGWLQNMAFACTSKSSNDVDEFDEDPLGWSRDLTRHEDGHFSMAAVQANVDMEDWSQVETGINKAFFVGIYDGHGGYDAPRYIATNIFQNLLWHLQNDGEMTEDTLRQAIYNTEEGFMKVIRRGHLLRPELASAGSCCLVGFIWNGTLYIANLGDSRAVLGSVIRQQEVGSATTQQVGSVTRQLVGSVTRQHYILRVQQLTTDHNCNNELIRQDLKRLHPDDPQIVIQDRGSWSVKGIIQVSRTIGDAYLKRLQFTLDPPFPQFEVPEPFTRGVLLAEPEIRSRVIRNEDRFLIFASDGFWEHISNEKAADIVCRFPRNGIAKRLLRTALAKAAKKKKISYKDLQGINKGHDGRLAFHDDITVIVVYLDHRTHGPVRRYYPEMSYTGFSEMVVASDFRIVQPTIRRSVIEY